MKACLSESGHCKEWKPLKALAVNFAQMDDGPFGKDYHFLIFDNQSDIAKLLDKFDESSELEFYFFKKILYISIESEDFMYIIKFFDEDLNSFSEQINKDKKIVIATMGEKKIENKFLYDIIM